MDNFAVALPPVGWYNYWTGARAEGTTGRRAIDNTAIQQSEARIQRSLDTLPVFVRAGAIIPEQPLVQSTMDIPKGPLELDIYPGPDCTGELYFDDGVSVNGPSLRQSIQCVETARGIALRFGQRQGSYRPWWKQIDVRVHGTQTTHMIINDQPRAAQILIPAAAH